jgi:RNA polymerase sigma-70 factor, ECF subfamily
MAALPLADSRTSTTAFAHSTELATRFETEALPLLDQLHRAAYRHTRHRADAEDLVQETLIRAWVGFASYTPGTNIRAWMLRIMVNVAISTHRRSERRPAEVLAEAFTDDQFAAAARHSSTGLPSAEMQALSLVADEALTKAFAELPERLRTVLYYADVEGFKYREIASLMGTPVGTVMSRIHRGRRLLRISLAEMAESHGYNFGADTAHGGLNEVA